jgi:hypothetical protein
MQNLAGNSNARNSAPATPAIPAAPVWGGSSPADVTSSAPSEYTRVIESSAARAAGAPVPSFSPQGTGGAPAAVGLPIAAAPKLPAPPAPPAAPTRLQAMLPWLLAANGVLLLLLIVLAFVFLRHHH